MIGKVAFVAGGTSGINLGIARRFTQVGDKVAVGGRDADRARRAQAQIDAVNLGCALSLSADVRAFLSS